MIGHQTIRQYIKYLLNQMLANQTQKVQVIFFFKENRIAIIAAIVKINVTDIRKGKRV
jgi:hypothetical protein